MRHLSLSLLAALVWLSLTAGSTQTRRPIPPQGSLTYERDIRPIFSQQCVGCHNRTQLPNAGVSGGLALDDYASMRAGVKAAGGVRAVLTPGKPQESELFLRLVTKDRHRLMPKGGEPLPAASLAVVRRWIETGAPRGAVVKPSALKDNPDLQSPAMDVAIPTPLALPAHLLPVGAAKDAKLSFTLKVGPLPPVTAVAYSPDGKLLAIGSYRSVTLFDTQNAGVERVLTESEGAVQSLDWSADGKILAVCGGRPGASGQVVLYRASEGYQAVTGFTGHTDVVYSVSVSPDGKRIATASQDKTIRIWNVDSKQTEQILRAHSDIVYRVRFAPNGASLFSCGQDRSVRQFETATGKLIRTFEGHQNGVNALAVRPDGLAIVTSGAEPRLRWWNVPDGATPRYSDGSSIQVNDITFSKSGKFLAAAAADRGVRVWDGQNGGLQKTFMDAPDWNYGVSFSPDERFVAGAGADGAVRIWDVTAGVLRATVFLSPRQAKGRPDYFLLGENGWFDVSTGWRDRITVRAGEILIGDKGGEIISSLHKAELIRKSLRGEKVEPPALPAAPRN